MKTVYLEENPQSVTSAPCEITIRLEDNAPKLIAQERSEVCWWQLMCVSEV
jgi:hypothetical protein